MRLLIIEDDRDAASYLAKGLKESGHSVEAAYNGRDGLLLAAAGDYDVLIVDRMLPELDGLSLVKTLRATSNNTPVLFLSALGQVDDRVKGLRSGGDDYLAKPYVFSELLARLEALGRRRSAPTSGAPETTLRYDDLSMDLLGRRVERAGREIDLQPREFKLLEALLRHAGQVMTRTMLLEKVWDYRFDPQTNVIDVHISRLRQKIDRGFHHPLIHTVRGAGYSLRAPDKAASSSTFRLTLLYLGTFSLSAVALLIGVYFTSVRFMERQTLETINVEVEGLLDQYRYLGLDGLARVIAQRAAVEPNRQSIYILIDRDGTKLAGNLDGLPPRQSSSLDIWRFPIEVTARAPRTRSTHQAIARMLELDGTALLMVGRDVEDKVRTQQLLRLAIGIGSALMVVLGLVGGYVMSRWMLHRLDIINRTTARIMAGELSRRIDVSDSDDEFDELGRNLNAMLDRIGRLLIGMRQVTDDIAHDLRTPLNRLRSRIEVALMGEPGPAETRDLLEATLHDADGLIDTFNALLNIARAETGALRGEYERFDLAELAHDVFELYEPLAEEKGISLGLEAPQPVQVEGHRQLLAQAVANVTDNAVKYTKRGGRVTIRTSGRPTPEISVIDNGPGIPPEQRERAKQRFVRLDKTRTSQGSGLGLSLVEAVAKLHEARFELGDAGPGLVASLVLRPIHTTPLGILRSRGGQLLSGMTGGPSSRRVNPPVASGG